jgi:cytochrome c oxidase subunit I+III
MAEPLVAQPQDLPIGPIGRHGLGWWGVGALIASEAALFGYLLFSYYYTAATAPPGWLLEPRPKMWPVVPNTILLLSSSFVAYYGEKGVIEGKKRQALIGLGGAFVMGLIFAAVQCLEWAQRPYGPPKNSYASLYFTTTGLHMAHVLVGLGVLAALFGWVMHDMFSPRRRLSVSAGILYWHFVDIVWLFVFTTYYITPYLGFGR